MKNSNKKRGGNNIVDMTGKTISALTVESRFYIEGKKLAYWKCKCKCGEYCIVLGADLRSGKTKTCGCRISIISRRNWQGYKEIPKTYWGSIVRGAEQRNIKFSLSIEDVYNLYIKQNECCKISGVQLSFTDNSASLDRIDSSKDYTIDNVQWVHKIVNTLKGSFSDNDLISWCKIIASFNNDSSRIRTTKVDTSS